MIIKNIHRLRCDTGLSRVNFIYYLCFVLLLYFAKILSQCTSPHFSLIKYSTPPFSISIRYTASLFIDIFSLILLFLLAFAFHTNNMIHIYINMIPQSLLWLVSSLNKTVQNPKPSSVFMPMGSSRQISSLTLFHLSLLLIIILILPVSNGAIYRIHDPSLTNKHKVMMMEFNHFPINFLTRGVPIPPSAPSKRQNVEPDGSTPAKDGQRD